MEEQPPKPKHFRKKINIEIKIDDDKNNFSKTPAPSAKKLPRLSELEPMRLYSCQHIDKKKFVFPDYDRRREIDLTLNKLCKLESEKSALLQELQRLREGAVSAIIEKEEVIQKLKEKIEMVEYGKDFEQDEKLKEKYELEIRLQQANRQLRSLQEELATLRRQFLESVEKKDALICELGEELEAAKLKVAELEEEEKALSEKLFKAESENIELQESLCRSKLSMSVLQESLRSGSIGASVMEMETLSQFQLSQRVVTQESGRNITEPDGVSESEQDYIQELHRQRQLNEEQRQLHRMELQYIKNFYQKKLQLSKKRYEEDIQEMMGENYEKFQKKEVMPIEDHGWISKANDNKSVRDYNLLRHEIQDQQQKYKIDDELASLVSRKQQRVHTHENQDLKSEFSERHFHYQPRLFQEDRLITQNSTDYDLSVKPLRTLHPNSLCDFKSSSNVRKSAPQHSVATNTPYSNDIHMSSIEEEKPILLNILSGFRKKDVGLVLGSALLSAGLVYATLKKVNGSFC